MARDFFDRLKQIDAGHKILRWAPWLTWVVRFVSGAVYRGMEVALGTHHPHTRVERQARRLAETESARARGSVRDVQSKSGERPPMVLFFTMRGWFAHVSMEVVLAKALELRGARTHFFLCGGGLPQCDFKPSTDPYVTPPLCGRCRGFGRRMLENLNLPYLERADVQDAATVQELAKSLRPMEETELLDFQEDGPLGEWVLPSVNRSLLRGDPGGDKWSREVLRGFVTSARAVSSFADDLLDRIGPDVVVMTNGSFFAERVMLERARRRGIEVVTYERGQPKNSIIFDRNQPVVPFETATVFERWRDQPLKPAEERRLDDYLNMRARGDTGSQELWPSIERDGKAVLRRLGIDKTRPLVTAYTNVMWDTAVFRRDDAFDGLVSWVMETIALANRLPDVQFIVRIHPAEIRLPMLESRDRIVDRLNRIDDPLPRNVVVVPPEDSASSYALMAASNCVLTYTSTIGLEAAARGIPVIVSGITHYREKGFTIDVRERRAYRACVQEGIRKKRLPEDMLTTARRYAYTFFFRYQRPFPWLDDSSRSERSLKLSDLTELAPGANAEMDRLCSWILDGGELPEPDWPNGPGDRRAG